jgi:hypothetical protein
VFVTAPLLPGFRLRAPLRRRESPKYEAAAMKWLRRYLDERSPTLKNFAKVVRSFEQRQLDE